MLFEITYGLECLALLAGLSFYRNIEPKSYRLILPLLALTVMNEGFSRYGLYTSIGLDKMVFFNAFFFIQYALIATIYLAEQNDKTKKGFLATIIFVAALAVVILLTGNYKKMNLNYISIISLSLVVLPFYYLFRSITKDEYTDLKQNSLLWFSIGLIIAQFLLFLYVNTKRIESFQNDVNRLTIFRTFNTIGNVFYYLCITYSFICHSTYRRRAGIS